MLIRLAERLPAAALGYKNLRSSHRAETTKEFSSKPAVGLTAYDGCLTDYFRPDDALALIEALLESPPRAIRSTSFSVNFTKFRWKGSPDNSDGNLNLFDLKAFKLKNRFSLSAFLKIEVDDFKSTQFQETVKNVAAATGIIFDKTKPHRIKGDREFTVEYGDDVLIAQICFDEAVEDARGGFCPGFVSEFAPNALSSGEALRNRIQAWRSGLSEKVNLHSIIRKTVKEIIPELKSKESNGGRLIFKKPFAADAVLWVVFEKTMASVGKAFTLKLGIENLKEHLHLTTGAFRLEGSTDERTWIYGNEFEAGIVAHEAVNLVKEVLPKFSASLKSYFDPWPKKLPAKVQRLGTLTAREAFDLALTLARKRYPDARLARIRAQMRSLATRNIKGPELSFDGRLNDNGAWWFHFYSQEADASFEITVPAVGRIFQLNHGDQYKEPHSRRYLYPIEEHWLDSDRVFAIAEERGGKKRRDSGKIFGVSLKLERSKNNQACWGLMYCLTDERGRNDFMIHLDAETGETVTGVLGF